MGFARWVFWSAGVYGLLVLLPFYFLEQRIGKQDPPAITHPEYYYGFVGVGVAWQLAFLVIGSDPARYRLMMLPAMVEKFSFAAAAATLFAAGRISGQVFASGMIDLVLGVLFALAYRQSGRRF